jgi:hypothetical protein
MHERELFGEDRTEIAKEISEAETLLAFYRTPDGRNRVVTTGYCFTLFLFLIVVLSRHIEVFAFFKKLIETIEKVREEEDVNKHVLEAIEYIKIYNHQKSLNNL